MLHKQQYFKKTVKNYTCSLTGHYNIDFLKDFKAINLDFTTMLKSYDLINQLELQIVHKPVLKFFASVCTSKYFRNRAFHQLAQIFKFKLTIENPC